MWFNHLKSYVVGPGKSARPRPSEGPLETPFVLGEGSTGFTGLRALSIPGFPFYHPAVGLSLAAPTDVAATAGAYSLRRRPYDGLPRLPAPPTPCYSPVASVTPMAGVEAASRNAVCVGAHGGVGQCFSVCAPTPLSVAAYACSAVGVAGCSGRVSLLVPAGMPVQMVCAFHGRGPVALSVRAACAMCGCALTLSHRRVVLPILLVGLGRFGPLRALCEAR